MNNEQETKACETPHEDVCDRALEHYEEISRKACYWSSTVVKAIKFYKEHGKKNEHTGTEQGNKNLV